MNNFLELRRFIQILLSRWWVLVIATLLAGLLGYGWSLRQTPIYKASASLAVGRTIQSTNLERTDFQIGQELATAYADVARRQPVLQGVVDALQLDQSWQELQDQVQAEPVGGTQLLEISAEAESPEQARQIADEVAHQLILLSPTPKKDGGEDESQRFVQQRLANLQTTILGGQQRLEQLEQELATGETASVDRLRQIQEQITALETLMATWDSTYARLLEFTNNARSANYLAVIEPAQAHSSPIRPRVKLNILLAAVIGLFVALGLVVLVEFLDDRLKSANEVNHLLGLPFLGAISRVKGERIQELLLTNQAILSTMAEDYRLLQNKIQFMTKDWPRKVILITSSAEDEGKSLTVANLGIALARAGVKTIIVDANLRNPTQDLLFGLARSRGLTDILKSPQPQQLDDKIKQSRVENLAILTSGDLASARPELLSPERISQLFSALADQADVVLCDTPETVMVADTFVIANQADGVLLVIDAGHTHRAPALQAVHNLEQTGAQLMGFVLNRVSPQMRAASLTRPAVTPSLPRDQVGAFIDKPIRAES
ncbi:MAG TPA: polysaccharide biosynthesis tyrosine autokinase [Caldilineaceae bacterium]|nr:polysaccharide biosynthesis tyrosine autokinase [Caldilineaceae bacterium]